jgi:hypothetical protein
MEVLKMEKFNLVGQYLTDMNLSIVGTDEKDEIFIVDDEDNGIKNMVIDCEEPILILEQIIMDVPSSGGNEFYIDLLKMNRNLVHGAFVLDEEGSKVIYRDTLQIDNLDLNELEGSINSLSLALSEFGTKLISYAQ